MQNKLERAPLSGTAGGTFDEIAHRARQQIVQLGGEAERHEVIVLSVDQQNRPPPDPAPSEPFRGEGGAEVEYSRPEC